MLYANSEIQMVLSFLYNEHNHYSAFESCAPVQFAKSYSQWNNELRTVQDIYHMWAIITRGLYIFTPFLKTISLFPRMFVQKNYVLMYSRAVSNQGQVIMLRYLHLQILLRYLQCTYIYWFFQAQILNFLLWVASVN